MKLSLTLNTLSEESYRICPTLSHGKQRKIKRNLKVLFKHLSNYGLIALKWAQFGYFNGLLFAFRHGTISSVCFASDGSVISVYHENFLQNKLASHRVSNIELLDQYILISYIEPYLTCVHLENNFDQNKKYLKFKIKSNCSIQTVNFNPNPSKPPQSKHRQLSISREHIMLWWNTTNFSNWSMPGTEGLNLSNLLILDYQNLSVITSETIEGEILKNCFVPDQPNKFSVLFCPNNSTSLLMYQIFELTFTVDQKYNKSETNFIKMELLFSVTIPLDKTCIYAEFTRFHDKILLHCDDESVMLFNIEQNVLYALHSSMPVYSFSSNPLDAIFVTSNQHGRLSVYDYAFNNIPFDVQHKDSFKCLPAQTENIFNEGTTVKRLQFLTPQLLVVLNYKRQDMRSSSFTNTTSAQNSSCQTRLLLLSLAHQVDFKLLTHQYLHSHKYEEALNLLRVINWNCYDQAYSCLNAIFQHLLKLPFNSELESRIESTLAAFLIPCTPIDYKIFEQILPYIRHLAIRFFFHLIQHHSYAKAYKLAIELKSKRHFMLLYEITKQNGDHELMVASYQQAQLLASH